jgi:hypothetical protein
MKRLKHASETLAKTPEEHLKTIANITQHSDKNTCNICVKHMQHLDKYTCRHVLAKYEANMRPSSKQIGDGDLISSAKTRE